MFSYAIAVLNSKKRTFDIYSAPVFEVSSRIKGSSNDIETFSAAMDYYSAKARLGEAFGTKKTKSLIKNQGRDKIDTSTFGNASKSFIEESIESKISLASKDQQQLNNENLYIPKINNSAVNALFVYELKECKH